ncbi:MAG: hypothetical protein NWQ46_00455 [Spirosomaceae bacterium]|nr:hypothetical protein [Spirosomataceae bacterium]
MNITAIIEWALVVSILISYLLGWVIKDNAKKVTIENLQGILIFLLIVLVFGKRISGLL